MTPLEKLLNRSDKTEIKKLNKIITFFLHLATRL